jgi:hypothetical protein
MLRTCGFPYIYIPDHLKIFAGSRPDDGGSKLIRNVYQTQRRFIPEEANFSIKFIHFIDLLNNYKLL